MANYKIKKLPPFKTKSLYDLGYDAINSIRASNPTPNYVFPQTLGSNINRGIIGNLPNPNSLGSILPPDIPTPTTNNTTAPTTNNTNNTAPTPRQIIENPTGYNDIRDANGLLVNPSNAIYDRNTGKLLNPTPVTPVAPVAPVTPVAPVAPEGSVASIQPYQSSVNPYQTEINNANAILQNTNQETNPSVIYKQRLLEQQKYINEINNIYNSELNKARLQGQNRIGSITAINARSGLLGSDIGMADKQNQVDANNIEQQAIQNQRAVALQQVYNKINQSAIDEANANKQAKTKGAEAMLQFYNVTKPAMKQKALSDAVVSLLQANVKDVNSLSPEVLQSYLTGLGVTKEEFINALKTQTQRAQVLQQEQNIASANLANKQANTANIEAKTNQVGKISPYQAGQLKIQKYKLLHPTLSVQEKQSNAISNIAQVLTQGAIIPNSGGIPFIDNNGFMTVKGFKLALRVAMKDNVSRGDFIATFADKIPQNLASKYGLTPIEIKKYITGVLPE